MRTREEKWIVTFPTAAAAMAMERRAKELRIPGRLIPTPTIITADCGLTWMAPVTSRDKVEQMLKENGLAYSEARALLI